MGNIQTQRIKLDDENITYNLTIKKEKPNDDNYCECRKCCKICRRRLRRQAPSWVTYQDN